ncbi:hypothetical protein V1318_20220 [Lysobacter sp. CCNWLW3]|uniref:hypothetical protein n=1 Tax=unclassified Lysobacter TaxID=2635362 RepID=UPI002FD4CC13
MGELRRQSLATHAGTIKAELVPIQGYARRAGVARASARDETHGFFGEKSRRQYYERVLVFLERNPR